MREVNDWKPTVTVCRGKQMPTGVVWQCFAFNGTRTLPALSLASRSCYSATSPPPPLPSICFLLGALEEAAGLPCIVPTPPLLLLPLCAQHTGRALTCCLMDAGLFRTTGRSSSGSDRGERHAEAS